jgi:hypothetical protein
MVKLLKWLDKNILEILVAFLLIFIPLYPKFPLIDLPQTWVYIRLEDFLVALTVGIWLIQLVRKKISIKVPLALPILVYWIIGGISLVYSIFVLNINSPVFSPYLGIFHYLRRIEYMVIFLVTLSTVNNLRVVEKYLKIIAITLLLVCMYGFGQKFLGFPAFLTMNEEFAKGIPVYLSPTNRIASTFAGHYDLASWLVLMIALFSGLLFEIKEKSWRIGLFFLLLFSLINLIFTASRISFSVYLLTVSLVLILVRQKKFIIPVFLLSLFLMNLIQGGVGERFLKTFRIQKVVYDVRTQKPLGVLENPQEAGKLLSPQEEVAREELPVGSGFINLPLKKETPPEATSVAVIKKSVEGPLKTATVSSEIATISGEFLIKRAIVYDISFTTRIQGTWKRAIDAFRRNPLLGSGYSYLGLASDSSYFRALGETGILGLSGFLFVIISYGLWLMKGIRKIKDEFTNHLIGGTIGGLFGLALNALFIDVFEASKVAFSFWMVLGITLGAISLNFKKKENILGEAKIILKNNFFLVAILLVFGIIFFVPTLNNYFVGDDFTWLRWAAEGRVGDIHNYFVNSSGFFYRPLAKTYFLLVYPIFGLKPQGYHLVDIGLHLLVMVGVFFLSLRLLKSKILSLFVSFLFLVHPINNESVLWISSTSHLMAAVFYIWGLNFYIFWREKMKPPRPWKGGVSSFRGKVPASRERLRFLLHSSPPLERRGILKREIKRRTIFLFLTIFSFILGLLSHEVMVTFPVVIIIYDFIFYRLQVLSYFPFLIIEAIYFWLRNGIAGALWFSGDYSYDLLHLPFNFLGNIFGYLGILVIGERFILVYELIRNFFRANQILAAGGLILLFLGVFQILKRVRFRFHKIETFAILWFVILLLPFLGLGNISERYTYEAQFGFYLLLAWVINAVYKREEKFLKIILSLILIALIVFSFKEIKKSRKNWYEAGEISNRVLLSLASNYKEFPSGTSLYFVNLPLKIGRAWVFPVGLEDGIWFIYKNKDIKVSQIGDKEAKEILRQFSRENIYVFVYENNRLRRLE